MLFSTWGVEDVGRVEKTWQQNGGRILKLSPADTKAFLTQVTAATAPILSSNAQLKDDYQAFLAAARKYRR